MLLRQQQCSNFSPNLTLANVVSILEDGPTAQGRACSCPGAQGRACCCTGSEPP